MWWWRAVGLSHFVAVALAVIVISQPVGAQVPTDAADSVSPSPESSEQLPMNEQTDADQQTDADDQTDADQQTDAPTLDSDERPEYQRFRGMGAPVVSYTAETGVTFAALAMMRWRFCNCGIDTHESSLRGAVAYTTSGQWFTVAATSMYTDQDRYHVGGWVRVGEWATDYFGIGDDTSFSDGERFTRFRVGTQLFAERAIFRRLLYAGIRYEFESLDLRDVEPGRSLDLDQPLGGAGGLTSGLGLSMSWDTRVPEGFPSRGVRLKLQQVFFSRAFGSDYNFSTTSLDGRGFVSLGRGPRGRHWSGEHVLALQGLADFTGGDAPFYELPSLGGMFVLRGLASNRFQDRHRLAAQVEYRTPSLWRFGMVGFGGVGDVFGEERLDLQDTKWAAGAGIRFTIDRDAGLNLRFDYGRSPNESGFYVSIGEAF
ncbi:MAG: outer membrane protein assembly factor BamA [Bradymonadia bacterium]|jgi:outer membrane protein assembly factor BamA